MMKNKRQFRKNNYYSVIFIAFFLILILSRGFAKSSFPKFVNEALAVTGTLNINAATGTAWTPGGIWNSDGTVGIGTTAPGQKLSVVGDIRAVGLVQALQSGGSNYMFTMDAANAAGPRLQLGTSTTPSAYFEIGAYNNRNNFDSKDRDLRVYNAGGVVFIQNSSGNVGIGNTAPGVKFDVTGTGRFSSTLTASSGLTLSAGTLSLPANSITDAMVSDTLTASLATTATNQSGGTVNATTGAFSGNVTFPGSGIWNSSGNVGIGTTAPGSKLEVKGANASVTMNRTTTGAANYALSVWKTAGTTKWQAGIDGDTSDSSWLLYDNAAAAYALTVKTGGNVGIGTVTPYDKLEVNGAIAATGAWAGNNSQGPATLIGYSGGIGQIQAVDWGSQYYNLSLNPGGGNVGIGNVSPGAKLAVSGDINLGEGLSGGQRLYAISSSYSYLEMYNASTGDMTLHSTYAYGDINFDTANSATPKMKIEYTGNVGIGTAAPGYKLDVAGTVYASGSSRDYKQDIKNLEVDSNKIYNLQPVSYDYKKEYKNLGYTLAGGRQFGLIAEDAYKVIPELVISKNDKKTANIDYEKLSVLLLAELKKLKITVDQQQKQINELQTIFRKTKP